MKLGNLTAATLIVMGLIWMISDVHQIIKAAQKHTEAHFALLEDQLQKLTDRIAALEGKK